MNRRAKWKRRLLIAAVSIAAAVVLTTGAGYLWYRQAVADSLPQTSGTIPVAGLKEPVQIVRDVYGVPHITAANEPDLYFGLGYAMAQDRLWQMDFMRRLGQGRLAEVLGAELLPADRFFRTISAEARLEPSDDPTGFATEAFTRGINAYLRGGRSLPLEFRLLGYRPEPWTEADHIAILRVMNWGLSLGWKVDLTAARMWETVGEERLNDAFPAHTDDTPPIVLADTHCPRSIIDPVAAQIRMAADWLGPWSTAASNNWVISGRRSASGKPILANDTHLELTNPAAWWEVHLTCPNIDAAGFAIPGLPGLAVGHSRQAAWGVTTVMADDVDFYIERIHPTNPAQYWNGEHWETMRSVTEEIRVKGEKPVPLDIRLTPRGPIFSDLEKTPADRTLSVRWTGRETVQTVTAVHRITQAEDVEDIVAALRHWHMPGQNVVFADTRGNIGYWCCATIPVRKQRFGLLPVPGWQKRFQWNGWIPFEQRPHEINPQRGFIASANNPVTDPDYPFHIGTYWEPQDRIVRIHQMLDTRKKLSVADFKRMQADVACPLAQELTPLLIAAVEKRGGDGIHRLAEDMLANWDFQMGSDSPAACLFEVTFHKLLRNIFADELDPVLFEDYMRTVIFPPRALRRIIRSGRSGWIDDIGTAPVENLSDIVEKSLEEALEELRWKYGPDPTTWRWGNEHTLTFEHVLGKNAPLDRLFNIGAFAVGGNHLTVSMALYRYNNPFAVYHGPSQRMIVDLANPLTAWHVLPTGESGQLGSAHYDDQVGLYLHGKYHPAWLSRADVERHMNAKLVLVPAEKSR